MKYDLTGMHSAGLGMTAQMGLQNAQNNMQTDMGNDYGALTGSLLGLVGGGLLGRYGAGKLIKGAQSRQGAGMLRLTKRPIKPGVANPASLTAAEAKKMKKFKDDLRLFNAGKVGKAGGGKAPTSKLPKGVSKKLGKGASKLDELILANPQLVKSGGMLLGGGLGANVIGRNMMDPRLRDAQAQQQWAMQDMQEQQRQMNSRANMQQIRL